MCAKRIKFSQIVQHVQRNKIITKPQMCLLFFAEIRYGLKIDDKMQDLDASDLFSTITS
jgi:hypothetical protein